MFGWIFDSRMITIDQLARAVQLPDFDPIPAQLSMAPSGRPLRPKENSNPRQAGVLVLVYPEPDGLHVVLTRRTENLRGHSGQISFPGGRHDPDDADFTATALRETCEELGICDPVQVLGSLSPIYIPPSNFLVYPTLAALPYRPSYRPNPDEVAEVFTLPLDQLLDVRTRSQEDWDFQGTRIPISFYLVRGHKVWGATAVILSELEYRLREVTKVKS